MAKVTIVKNGPILIEGDHEVFHVKDKSITDNTVKEVTALCRCGKSANNPFCDGTHAKCGFDVDKNLE